MICSMTAFGSARATSANATITVELRSVNNRFLDCSLRLPEDLRGLETALRTQLGQTLKRGKVEMRVQVALNDANAPRSLNAAVLQHAAAQLALARRFLPDTPSPTLQDLMHSSASNGDAPRVNVETLTPTVLQTSARALQALQENRQREGQRLAQSMLVQATDIAQIVATVTAEQPALLAEYQEKIAHKLRDALQSVSPEGYANISGAELSARIAQETSLFSLRVDIAEELTRLHAHGQELHALLGGGEQARPSSATGSLGKRLDFLFQEMQREANTLGSKSASLLLTRAAIDLKLLIEQLREQAQNIE